MKTLTDPTASTVRLTPVQATIDTLRRLRAPARDGTRRIGRTERTNVRLRARLLSAKIEATATCTS